MKTTLYCIAVICTLMAACNNNTNLNSESNNTAEEKEEAKKNITKRDYSINKSNSYSDLFMDSAAVENYIASRQDLDEKATRRLRSFYNARNYQFAWFNTSGLTEQARSFWNLHDYVTTYDADTTLRDKSLQKKMEALTVAEKLSPKANGDYVQTELTLTQHFIKYMLSNYEKGYVKRKEMERFVPFKKRNPVEVADSLLNKKHKDDKYFEDVHPTYGALKKELQRYYAITKAGGWPTVPAVKTALKLGDNSPAVAVIKQRLQVSGDMPKGDTTQLFNDTLEVAVKRFQQRFGYTPTGKVSTQLVKDMNVTAEQRLEQILMNMDRMRWMPAEPTGQLIVVNIPEFMLHMYEGKQKAFDMNVVVGKEGHNTVSFSGDLSTVVFSPYWNVPPSIVKNEIMPKMSDAYLASQNMEVVGNSGGLPVVRQRPGGNNSLGKVKFLFPNSFNIYFHDTPSKSLFERDKRAYSHGCIRLAEPEKMAQYLLRNDAQWPPEKIAAAMNAGEEKQVRLSKPVPVMITYYTAWVDGDGLLNFRDDIYSHDKDLGGKMFL